MLNYSIIICTYNRVDFLKETIDSLLSHFKDHSNYELLIIDNKSTDNTAEVVKPFLRFPQVRYVLETNQGLSYARNRGIKEAKNDVLIFLDDDIDIEANYLDICDQIYSDPNTHIVGGKVLPYQSAIPDWMPEQFYYLMSIFDIGNSACYTQKLMGANYSMRREAVQKIGWYNVELGRKGSNLMGGEEVDYLNRASDLGYRILYRPDLIVYHKINNKLNKAYIFDYAYYLGKSERIIDIQRSKARFLAKCVKAVLMIGLHAVYGFYAPKPKQQTYFKIKQLYSFAYLNLFKARYSKK
ncbi:glycosyltransferase family 2 protein [Spirosoma fluviale]|uniref:Glycosyltransferase, GT2 family n=1 Tax=Spirosoma fluviale TaxID=1597977 RepID=A0A286G554_9BACT|nr:glycosyltransferase [Spirosoma fluviale]SOD90114.1 Glycosyltransferase, GT2 family [Spirosoma fluviale]